MDDSLADRMLFAVAIIAVSALATTCSSVPLNAQPSPSASERVADGDTLPPAGVREESWTLERDGARLPGTIALPASTAGPVPVVLIVAGSGPTNRQGNSMGAGIRPWTYARLAWGLSEQGIASARYDKRLGSTVPGLDHSALTLADYRDDVIAGARTLAADPRFSAVFLLGHSEGATLVVQAANEGAPAKGVILAAGMGRPFTRVLMEQLGRQVDEATLALIERAFAAYLAGDPIPEGVPPGVKPLLAPVNLRFVRSLVAYDASAEVARIRQPMLLVHGETDLQVTLEDLEVLRTAAPNAAVLRISNANHVFKHSTGTSVAAQMSAYMDPTLPLVPELVPGIVDWVRRVQRP